MGRYFIEYCYFVCIICMYNWNRVFSCIIEWKVYKYVLIVISLFYKYFFFSMIFCWGIMIRDYVKINLDILEFLLFGIEYRWNYFENFILMNLFEYRIFRGFFFFGKFCII